MGRNRFVNTNPSTRETIKVELSDGDYVLFKRELSNKEERKIKLAGFGNMKGKLGKDETEILIDWEAMEFERVLTYLHGWSFADAQNKPVQLNRQNLENVDDTTFQEIKEKLDEFVGEKEKNASGSAPTSRLKRVGAGSTSSKSP